MIIKKKLKINVYKNGNTINNETMLNMQPNTFVYEIINENKLTAKRVNS